MTEDETKAPEGGEDDLQRRFRAALERKKNSKHAGSDSPRERGKTGGPSDAKVKRQFRRKSG